MEQLLTFLLTALTALAVHNAIFARALGIGKTTLFLKSPRMGILYGGLLTLVGTVSSLLVALSNFLLRDTEHVRVIRAPVFYLCVALVYVGVYFGTRKFFPGYYRAIKFALPISTFNSAMFGAFYVSAYSDHSALQTVGYAFGAGVGYTLALLVIYYARKRLAISPVPRVFRGLPILLVYIGLLSLAIYGLIGYGLPT